ncbi:MAG TPA: GIY-YIG nuclease family protein [Sedimentisphaerales bacterium]|nr:GIY-YIG nuclease family protein [Sedimentisphaerales bacterium]
MTHYWVHMMTNRNKTVIYTGVTNDLSRRVQEHRTKEGSSFAKKYNVTMLVYYESFSRIHDAIAAEKKIKAGSRAKKIALIESVNPGWKDLYV